MKIVKIMKIVNLQEMYFQQYHKIVIKMDPFLVNGIFLDLSQKSVIIINTNVLTISNLFILQLVIKVQSIHMFMKYRSNV